MRVSGLLFCLKASASHIKQWSVIDITIWNMLFPDRVISHMELFLMTCLFQIPLSIHPATVLAKKTPNLSGLE